jgi:hypothetical protein
MKDFDSDSVLDGLKQFQRDAVEHAISRLYAPTGSRKFLVADETGLGKSIIARGVVARAVEQLQDDDSVDRIDVVYICSSTELANQNLRRLDITGNAGFAASSRLTLLARDSARFDTAPFVGKKRVNLVAFTPGTALDVDKSRQGRADERALLVLLLEKVLRLDVGRRDAMINLFRCTSKRENFGWEIRNTEQAIKGPIDRGIRESFHARLRTGLDKDFWTLLHFEENHGNVWAHRQEQILRLVSRMRAALAEASVATLTPDLVILDEFQRFRHLLNPDNGPAATLAHALFNYEGARVLLLSATPYKPYTVGRADLEDDHYRDFMATLGFLTNREPDTMKLIADGFAAYGKALRDGTDATLAAAQISGLLSLVMSRTERPRAAANHPDGGLPQASPVTLVQPETQDLVNYAHLRGLGVATNAPISIEQWKSIPHFAHFLKPYAVGRVLDGAATDAALRAAGEARSLDPSAVRDFQEIDLANGRLRALAAETVDAGLWKLLWMPASMPYFAPAGPYEDIDSAAVTKRLVFSAWTATPTAIASLLSYRADRLAAIQGGRMSEYSSESRRAFSRRLGWRLAGDQPASMSTLALFWPHPELARRADPLRLSGTASDAERSLVFPGEPRSNAWEAYFSIPGRLPVGANARGSFVADVDEDGFQISTGALDAHLEVVENAEVIESTHPELAALALHGPGNVAWRALGRLRRDDDQTSDAGHWTAAVKLGEGLRSMFNRVDTHVLLGALYGTELSYWRSVLKYVADGNLQSVLDEYLWCLRSELAGQTLTDALLDRIADDAARAMTVRAATYLAPNPATIRSDEDRISFTARFALRYGSMRDEDAAAERDAGTRRAFNSPFQPFVLASTSVGQEGIDFHWWSHIVVHWNLPPNPVDFEQREGRVDRYAGHAVRKNVAAAHSAEVLTSDARDPWAMAFDLATLEAEKGTNPFGEFSPWWMYPGPSSVGREILAFVLSYDLERYAHLRRALTLYRLTLGQPAQADLVELLEARGVNATTVAKIDLRPPSAGGSALKERGAASD